MEEINETIVQPEIANIATALNKAQACMEGAKKDKKNPFFNSTYADLASVFEAIREPFASNGLSVTQTMDVLENGVTVLITRLMHVSGESIDSKMIVPIDPNPQRVGSCLTYYRRYALMAIAGIPAEDDDGNAAAGKTGKSNRISLEQIAELRTLINGYDSIKEKVLKACGGDLGSITIDRFQNAIDWVNKMILERSVEKAEKVEAIHE